MTMPTPLLLSLLLLAVLHCLDAVPVRANVPWTILLCKYSDFQYEPRPRDWFDGWLDPTIDGSIAHYYATVSNGQYTMAGSNVVGWFRLPYTRSDVHILALLKRDNIKQNGDAMPLVKTHDLRIFDTMKRLCRQTARSRGHPVHPNTITVMNDQSAAIYCHETGVLLTPPYLLTAALAHEMAHSMAVGHSYSDQQVRVFPHALIGEYDDKYDLMSTANAFMYASQRYGYSGPGMNGPHLDYLGWLPVDRVVYFGVGMRGSEQRKSRRLRLASLSVPHADTQGNLLVMLPYDRHNPLNVYTVEWRTQHGYDRALPRAGLLIHQVKYVDGHYYSFLIKHSRYHYDLGVGDEWLQFVTRTDSGQYMTIKVKLESVNDELQTADVHVVSTFTPTGGCLHGERKYATLCWPNTTLHNSLWQAFDGQLQAARTNDNGACSVGFGSRWLAPMPAARCLTEPELGALADLVADRDRRTAFYDRETFGMNACRQKVGSEPLVWRLIDTYDYVCVTRRQQADAVMHNNYQTDNGIIYSATTDECLSVSETEGEADEKLLTKPRRAFPADSACVPPDVRALAHAQNFNNTANLATIAFFNGRDAALFENGSNDHLRRRRHQ